MKKSAYIEVGQNKDGTVLVVRTNSAGGIAVKYRGYIRYKEGGVVLYPDAVNHALLEPGIVTSKHFIYDQQITFERSTT